MTGRSVAESTGQGELALDRPPPPMVERYADRLDPHDEPVAVELHHLPSEEVVWHDHTAESLARHLGRAEAYALAEHAPG
jgi:hypothetical protein